MIRNIKISNVIGINTADITVGEQITLICGGNATGKSSALDAIATAVTGQKHRNLQPVPSNSVLAGEILAESSVAVTDQLGDLIYGMVDGKVISKAKGDEFAVVPGAYLRLSVKDRIRMLMSVCRIRVDPREIVAGFSGIAEEDREVILGRAAIDMDTAEAWCREQARKLKARWQSITGQEWGTKKSARWSAIIPDGDLAELDSGIAQLQAGEDQSRERWNKLTEELGAANAAAKAPMRDVALIDADIATLKEELSRLEVVAGMQGTIEPCPHCGQQVVRPATGGPLQKATGDPGESVITATTRRAEVHREIATLERERGSAQAALELRTEHRPIEVIVAEREAAGTAGATQKKARLGMVELAAKIREATEATSTAREIHKRIEALLAAAEELSPAGARARAISTVISRVNAAIVDITPIKLGDDGEPFACGHPLRWLSESEQWRAEAGIAMALSAISGSKLLLLDRFDVVEPTKRMLLLGSITSWAAANGAQVILAATLKAKPEIPGVSVHWMGG